MVGPGIMPSQILLVTRAENRYYPPIGDGLPLDLQLHCQVYCLDGVFIFLFCVKCWIVIWSACIVQLVAKY